MANLTGRDGMWTPQIWSDIDRAVTADVGRVRVAQKIFPSQQKPNQDNVQADILTLGDAPGGPLMIREGVTLPFLEISAKFALTESQMKNEANLRSAQTLAQLSARRVALAEDLLFFQGTSVALPEGVTVSNAGSSWTGLLNIDGMLKPIDVPAMANGLYGENTFRGVSQGISALISVGHPGPYALVLETDLFADIHAPVPNTLVTTADRISPLVEGRLYGTGTLPPNTALLVSLGGNPTTIHIAQDVIAVTNWQDPFGNYRFRVYERVQVVAREPNAFVKLAFKGHDTKRAGAVAADLAKTTEAIKGAPVS